MLSPSQAKCVLNKSMRHTDPGAVERCWSEPDLVACEKFHKFPLLLFRALRILFVAVRNMAVCTLLALVSILSAACGPRITNANLDVVENERVSRDTLG